MKNREPFDIQTVCCQQVKTVNIDREDFANWKDGMLAQRAFPYLSNEDRELLISKTCGECWKKMFNFEGDDEE